MPLRAQYAANLRRYVAETREKGAVPVLLTPVVRRRFTGDALDDHPRTVAAAVRRVAAKRASC